MARWQLVTALDFSGCKGEPHVCTYYRVGENWYACKSGPTYSNTYKLSGLTEKETAWLLTQEKQAQVTTSVTRDKP